MPNPMRNIKPKPLLNRLLAATLFALLISLTGGCGFFNTAQPPEPPENQLLQALQARDLPQVVEPELIHFSMLDGVSGWGLTASEVLRTLDSGRSWFKLTEIDGLSLANAEGASFFLDADSAWVLAGSGEAQIPANLHHTADGGLTWQVYSPPFNAAQLFFIDAQQGWALVITGVAAGSTGVEIYRTSDGGENWNLAHRTDPQSLDQSGQLPFSGSKNGLSFRDAQHGFLGGSVPAEGYVYLYETPDGGVTWQQSALELPDFLQSSFLSFQAPVFFSANSGKLVVEFQGPQGTGQMVFTTNNGGERWIATTPLLQSGQVHFVSMQSGRIWDGESLYATNDGGLVWVQIASDLRPGAIPFQFQFVNVSVGFALVIDAAASPRFYQTEDSGTNWVRLP